MTRRAIKSKDRKSQAASKSRLHDFLPKPREVPHLRVSERRAQRDALTSCRWVHAFCW